ncbi:uroporphyrinogen-III synthase [Mesobacillus maritimus]|uniref:uroporphyrinogen-III synthase n=1 Tax=Mesobacillus maritimus TaxID=1643336 RepID=UPI00203D0A6E|nr:uroporphyrinogen-III synthase [Mesobacillus maritimus]MCM3585157.1 uroporphyrinogen-III synthase [Mesobacillus maritimus]
MKRLEGKRVVLAGSRKLEEMSKIITNLGGIPVLRPAQGTTFLDDSRLEDDLREFVTGKYDWLIFTTGLGIETLYKTAENLGIGQEFLTTIRQSKVAARGYKTVNALKKMDVIPLVRDDDGSTAGLVRALKNEFPRNTKVALQLHGDPAPKLISFLDEMQADYKEILPYQHIPPKQEILEQLVDEVVSAEVDAVYFTSTPQGRFLFSFAREQGKLEKLLAAFEKEVVAVAVGKVTAASLRDEGLKRVVVPDLERMGSGIIALEKFYENEQPTV